MKSLYLTVVAAALLVGTPPVEAQWLSVGLRGTGSVPTGDFAEDEASSSSTTLSAARNGFGYGVDVGIGVGMLGLYGGFDRIRFECEVLTCNSNGKYTLRGVSAGLKLAPRRGSLLSPFVKGGVTFNELHGQYGASSSTALKSDRAPGYEIGAGVDLSLLGVFTLAPQLRFVGQQLKVRFPGVTSPPADAQGVNYLTFDLGLMLHTPFGSLRR